MIPFQVPFPLKPLEISAKLNPVLLVAIPIGKLGDHHGRRKIMALSLIGVAASLVEIFVVCSLLLLIFTGLY